MSHNTRTTASQDFVAAGVISMTMRVDERLNAPLAGLQQFEQVARMVCLTAVDDGGSVTLINADHGTAGTTEQVNTRCQGPQLQDCSGRRSRPDPSGHRCAGQGPAYELPPVERA